MLDRYDRQFVQRVREADEITIVADEGRTGELRLSFVTSDVANIKKLTHDIAVAIQDFMVRNGRRQRTD